MGPLALLVNNSFTSSYFRNKLKLARISSVFKEGSRLTKTIVGRQFMFFLIFVK